MRVRIGDEVVVVEYADEMPAEPVELGRQCLFHLRWSEPTRTEFGERFGQAGQVLLQRFTQRERQLRRGHAVGFQRYPAAVWAVQGAQPLRSQRGFAVAAWRNDRNDARICPAVEQSEHSVAANQATKVD